MSVPAIPTNKPFGFLDDDFGNHSSKRLWGSITLGIGLILAITLFIVSIFFHIVDNTTCIKVLEFLFTSGTALLGIGVIEGFTHK
jgi:hypothetical protein